MTSEQRPGTERQRQLYDLLLELFSSEAELQRMLQLELDWTLDHLTSQGGLQQRLFELTSHARQHNRLDELEKAALGWGMRHSKPAAVPAAVQLLDSMPLDSLPERTLPMGSRMRLPRNQQFVGRDEELQQIAAALKRQTRPIVVSAIGGMGKTQLAVEIVYRYGRYFGGGVYWLSFAEPQLIPAEIADCVSDVTLAALAEPERERLVRQSWHSEMPRLLVFDNLDDDGAEQLLLEHMPAHGNSRVLVTSRRSHWSSAVDVVHVPLAGLGDEAGRRLLQGLAPRLDDGAAYEIAVELGGLPLALFLAGSYLSEYEDVTAGRFLRRVRQKRIDHRAFTGEGVTPTRHTANVHATFALSWDRLDAERPVDRIALQLLHHLALFALGEPVARHLLHLTLSRRDDWPPDEDAEEVADLLRAGERRLLQLGLLTRSDADRLRLHRLLAQFVLAAGADERALPAVEHGLIAQAYELNMAGSPGPLRAWRDHLQAVTDRALQREDERASTLANNFATHLEQDGNYPAAQPLYERALAIREKVLGAEHPDTATSLNNLAGLYYAQGAYERAQPLFERAPAIREKVLGAEHPDTATSLNNLAELYKSQGAYERALPLFERALAIREKGLGAEHPQTATSLNNLAGLYESQGAYERAQPLVERALAIREKGLGAEHPDTATSLNNLAALYESQGAYERAQPLYERALAISEKVLGAEHPSTAASLNNLALLYESQGAYERALPLYERALVIREKVLGAEHPDTAASLNNLAALYQSQGAYERAQPLYERALAIREKVLGAEHPDTATSLNNLAALYQSQGAYERALPLYERALAIWEKVLGAEHPQTATSLNNLAALYQSQGAYERAQPLVERALAIKEKVLGAEHPSTATSLNNLAALYESQGAYERAQPLVERALAIEEKVLGAEHPQTATSLNNLAALYQSQGAYERAQPLYERALAIREKVLGAEHPDTAISLVNLGALLAQQGDRQTARKLLVRALAIFEQAVGAEHPYTVDTRSWLASLSDDG